MTDLIKAIQKKLGITVDGVAGSETWKAIAKALGAEVSSEWRPVKASSFADPADVAAFKRCKADGGTDQECFKVGDNGIGKWGHKTAQSRSPMAALPRGVWTNAGKEGGAKIEVRYGDKTVAGILGDTLPAVPKHGVGIDLNPAFARKLGLKPPFLVNGVSWRW